MPYRDEVSSFVALGGLDATLKDDAVDPRRSALMSRVRQRDTSPELVVRKVAHSLGLRFRLQRRDLPGRPDVVFPSRRIAVFVHGCFWHRHQGCSRCTTPKARKDFWAAKFAANIDRDERATTALIGLGWKVIVIWECETFDQGRLRERIVSEIVSIRKAP